MKLIIQIPCYNEEATLPETLRKLPKEIPGIDTIEVLIIDDGSTDKTVEVARQNDVDHVIRHTLNRGLAAAFQTGLDRCLELGADIVVNMDADNQYPGHLVPALIQPILSGDADMVIGDRKIHTLSHLSRTHRFLQSFGSSVVRRISGTHVPDAPSGFRAISREASFRLEVLTDYTYTLETIIQAKQRGLRISVVSIEVNKPTRVSRLKRSQLQYVMRSATTILRLYALYRPLKTFLLLGLPFLIGGTALWIRYLALIFIDQGGRGAHVQSVVVGGALILIAVLLGCLGILGDIMAKNRSLSERTLYISKRALFSASPSATQMPKSSRKRSRSRKSGQGNAN